MALTFPVLQQLGFTWRPRIAAAAFAPKAEALDRPLVQATEAAFIQALLDAPPLQPQSASAAAGQPTRNRCCSCCCATRCSSNTWPPRRAWPTAARRRQAPRRRGATSS